MPVAKAEKSLNKKRANKRILNAFFQRPSKMTKELYFIPHCPKRPRVAQVAAPKKTK